MVTKLCGRIAVALTRGDGGLAVCAVASIGVAVGTSSVVLGGEKAGTES